MTTEIKVAEEKVIGDFTQPQLNVLQHTIAKDTTLAQFDLFVQTCVNSGLNPFLNHIYCIVYGQTMSIQIAVEGILYLARQKEGYLGIDTQLVHENDEFRLGRDENTGEMKVKVHDIGFPRGQVTGGYAIAKRKGFEDVICVMEACEVEEFKKGKNQKMWKDYFSDMFKKHMTKRAAKLQFGVEINEDESFTAGEGLDTMEGYDPSKRKEINDEFQEEPKKVIVTSEEEKPKTEEELFKEQWDIIAAHTKTYDLKKKDINAIIKERFKKKVNDLSLQEVAALTKFVEIEGQTKQSTVIDVEAEPEKEAKQEEEEPKTEIIDKPKTEEKEMDTMKEIGNLFEM